MNQSNFNVEAAAKAIKTTILLFIGIPILIWVVGMLYGLSIVGVKLATAGIVSVLQSMGYYVDFRIIEKILYFLVAIIVFLIAFKVFKRIRKGVVYKKDDPYERAIKKLELFNATGNERYFLTPEEYNAILEKVEKEE
jgi:hypothetical protein